MHICVSTHVYKTILARDLGTLIISMIDIPSALYIYLLTSDNHLNTHDDTKPRWCKERNLSMTVAQ